MQTRTLVFALASLGPLAAAQDSGQVIKELKQHSKELLADYKQAFAQAAKVLDSQIDIFELHFGDPSFDYGPVEDFVAALVDYQAAAGDAQVQEVFGMELWTALALEDLPTGGPDEDVAPVGLTTGDGGVMDDHIAAAKAIAAKAYAGVNKKLAKLAKKLRKKTDMRLAILLQPDERRVFAPSDSGTYETMEHTIDIDLVVGFDRGGVDDDGRIWVGGTAPWGFGSVTVSISGEDSASGSATPTSGFVSRWSMSTDSQLEPLEEGNYVVLAFQASGNSAAEAIGLR